MSQNVRTVISHTDRSLEPGNWIWPLIAKLETRLCIAVLFLQLPCCDWSPFWKTDHIQLTSYRWYHLLRVTSLGREVSVRILKFWSHRSLVSPTAHSLNFLHNWISIPVAGFWAALNIEIYLWNWLQCNSTLSELSSGSQNIVNKVIVLELLGRLS